MVVRFLFKNKKETAWNAYCKSAPLQSLLLRLLLLFVAVRCCNLIVTTFFLFVSACSNVKQLQSFFTLPLTARLNLLLFHQRNR